VRLGQRAAEQVRREERVLPANDARVQLVRRVGDRVLSQLSVGDRPWQFTFDVVQNNQMNAFALPGGPVFINTGLLDRMQTEDQLAGIIGHEIIHIHREHWASAYEASQTRGLGLAVLLSLFRANRTIANIASISNDLLFTLPYSRNHEVDADNRGMDLMIAAGYNPQGMVDVFRLFQQHARGGRPPEWLSTHPDDRNRIQRLENRIRDLGGTHPPQRPMGGAAPGASFGLRAILFPEAPHPSRGAPSTQAASKLARTCCSG
jgi:predicted Zn-dependent protease